MLRLLLLNLLLLSFLITGQASAREFSVDSLNLYEEDNIYYMDANLTLKLKEAALEALRNGVAIYLEVSVDVLKKNRWFIDGAISKLSQRYKIEYFELAKLYQLTNLNTKKQDNYLFLGSVLLEIGNFKHYPVLDKVLLQKDEEYYLEVEVDLLTSKLPLPLIPIALVDSDWEHESSVYRLSIK